MNFMELAAKRYSVRRFTNQPVEDEKIEKILEAANLAPTSDNRQPFHIWILKSDGALKKVRDITKLTFNANTVLVLGANPEVAWIREWDNENFANVDASIVGTHMMLEIDELGLGTTWIGRFDAPQVKEAFPEMKNHNIIALFPIGYPDIKPSPNHTKRKDISSFTDIL